MQSTVYNADKKWTFFYYFHHFSITHFDVYVFDLDSRDFQHDKLYYYTVPITCLYFRFPRKRINIIVFFNQVFNIKTETRSRPCFLFLNVYEVIDHRRRISLSYIHRANQLTVGIQLCLRISNQLIEQLIQTGIRWIYNEQRLTLDQLYSSSLKQILTF